MKPRWHRWRNKFRVAISGALWAVRSQVNFKIHLAAALLVLAIGALLGASGLEIGLLVLCITLVLAAEAMNTAIEHLARAVSREPHEEIGRALDVAAGAVLIASCGAAVVGGVILLNLLRLRIGG